MAKGKTKAIKTANEVERIPTAPQLASFRTRPEKRSFYISPIGDNGTPARLEASLVRLDGGYCIRKEVRARVIFSIHSAIKNLPINGFNIISRRNFLIYRQPGPQKLIMLTLHYSPNSGGGLFPGSVESTRGLNTLFEPMDKKWKIYRSVRQKSRLLDPTDYDDMADINAVGVR